MSWLERIVPSIIRSEPKERKASVPEGLWRNCPKCLTAIYCTELERNQHVCPKCEHHLRISARTRLETLLDADSQEELFTEVEPVDKLKFKDGKRYQDRLKDAQKATNEKDALITMRGKIQGLEVVTAAFEFNFMGGSMGSVVGEKFARAAELAYEHRLPFICFSASGGARMQEALFSLMQMAKTSAVIEKLKQAGIPYISVLTDPVYGGVSASLAMLGDLNLSEPFALCGFAGPRVIEQTVREKLPEGFQRAEFLLDHGTVDMIIHRHEMKAKLGGLLRKLTHQPAA